MKRFLLRFKEVDYANFQSIVEGKKSVEIRAASPKYQNISPSDILVMTCRGEKAEKIVKSIRHYRDLDEMFNNIEYKKIAPTAASRETAMAVYSTYPGYPEKLQKFGILAIELRG